MSKRPTRRAKQPNRSGGGNQRGRRPAGPSPVALAHQLVESFAGIAADPDPMQLEMTASALVAPTLATWWENADDGHPHPAEAVLALLGNVREKPFANDALALAYGLRALAATDEQALSVADATIHKLRFLGARPTPAALAAGTATPTEAWTHADVWGDQVTLSIGYAYASSDSEHHTLSVLIDANLESIKDAFLALPIDELVPALRAQVQADPEAGPVMRLEQIDLDAATALLYEALDWTSDSDADEVEDEDAFDLLPLIQARFDELNAVYPQAAASEVSVSFCDRPSELDDLTELELNERFLASAEYAAEQPAGANNASAEVVVSFAMECMIGGVARFGPIAPEWLIHGFLAECAASSGLQEEYNAGLAATMRAWARYTHRLLALPDEALEFVLGSIEQHEADIASVLDGRIAPPVGFAARMVAEMQARGMDPADPEQLEAFQATFNELSFEERSRILGVE